MIMRACAAIYQNCASALAEQSIRPWHLAQIQQALGTAAENATDRAWQFLPPV